MLRSIAYGLVAVSLIFASAATGSAEFANGDCDGWTITATTHNTSEVVSYVAEATLECFVDGEWVVAQVSYDFVRVEATDGVVVDDPVVELDRGLPDKGEPARGQLVHDDSERVDVGAAVDALRLPGRLLRRKTTMRHQSPIAPSIR